MQTINVEAFQDEATQTSIHNITEMQTINVEAC